MSDDAHGRGWRAMMRREAAQRRPAAPAPAPAAPAHPEAPPRVVLVVETGPDGSTVVRRSDETEAGDP